MSRRRLSSVSILFFLNLVVWTTVVLQKDPDESFQLEERASQAPQFASPEIRSPFQEPITASAEVADALLKR